MDLHTQIRIRQHRIVHLEAEVAVQRPHRPTQRNIDDVTSTAHSAI